MSEQDVKAETVFKDSFTSKEHEENTSVEGVGRILNDEETEHELYLGIIIE